MKEENKNSEAELVKPRRPSTKKELTEKARQYIFKQAGLDSNGKEPEETK